MSTAIADATDPVRTYLEHPSAPRLQLPALSCDSHVHVFGPVARFPYAADRRATPLEAPKEKLFALHRRMGIERCVIVQSIVHGTDNRVVEDAIAAGEGRYLGIALVEPDVPDAELQRLAQVGFRGVRFNFMRHITHGANIDAVMALTPRLAAVGMHLQVHFESELVHELSAALQRSQVPVVIDHMGRVDATRGPDHADFQALLRLLDNPRFYVKVSGIDRIDAKAPPEARYRHGVVLARALVERFAERCVWGSDWPHPNHTHMPDDGILVDALAEIAPGSDLLEQLLVQNPAALYKFPTP
ncbi:amidohydrolase family protein [Variovorax sp. EBFNA2]|uniref:amidohydrolase family protein n=1 Tax=Variovorax sp. EBFNA2 TaxID=3342097 RepID=UPI0029C005F2|nr:amidohydrolase family protein [Variovorax boronicumulans]WPG41419.1 amidohydrolase family protein [Variovorax boronicumulans]